MPKYRTFFATEIKRISTQPLVNKSQLQIESNCNQIEFYCQTAYCTANPYDTINFGNWLFQNAPRVDNILLKPELIFTVEGAPLGSQDPAIHNSKVVFTAPDENGIIEQKFNLSVKESIVYTEFDVIIVRRYIKPI